MTRLPADAYAIEPMRGDEWPDYKVAPLCALIGCSHFSDHAHHVVRRSFTAGPYSWVKIEGKIVGNLIPLCWRHHQQVTENKTRIVWDNGIFFWQTEDGFVEDLRQPPSIEMVRSGEAPAQVEQPPKCPTCGQKVRPSYPHSHEEKRPRKTWTITVPADAREVGADVLDTLLESARMILDDKGMSYGDDRKLRYFVLSTSLGLFVAHADDLLA